mgnify:CR=1 FL=1
MDGGRACLTVSGGTGTVRGSSPVLRALDSTHDDQSDHSLRGTHDDQSDHSLQDTHDEGTLRGDEWVAVAGQGEFERDGRTGQLSQDSPSRRVRCSPCNRLRYQSVEYLLHVAATDSELSDADTATVSIE